MSRQAAAKKEQEDVEELKAAHGLKGGESLQGGNKRDNPRNGQKEDSTQKNPAA